ncbi:VirB4 family type IV secretion/conjugal transfer ATPase [Pseudomonas gingeri]
MHLVDKLFKKLTRNLDLSVGVQQPNGSDDDLNELEVSEFIPYDSAYDDETLMTKENALVQVMKLDGLYFDSLSDAQVKQFENRRNTLLRSIASSNFGIYVHVIRRKIFDYVDGEGSTWFAKQFNAAWRNRYMEKGFYINEIYISVVRTRFRAGVPGLMDRGIALMTGTKATAREPESFESMAADLYKASGLLLNGLSEYGARRLGIQRLPVFESKSVSRAEAYDAVRRFRWNWQEFKQEHGDLDQYPAQVVVDYLGEEWSEIATFLHYLVNLEDRKVPVSDLKLCEQLPYARLNFQVVATICEVQGSTSSRIGTFLCMSEWPRRTPSRMMNRFMQQPVEFIITQSFYFTDRIAAESQLTNEQRRLAVADKHGVASDDTAELTEGLKSLRRGDTVNGWHHLTIFVHVPALPMTSLENRKKNVETLDTAVSHVEKCFIDLNVKSVREWLGAETFFWSQLPGQSIALMGRRGKIKSSNFAGFASLHNFATGRKEGNLWGFAITVFETESGTPYYFNFHRELEGMVAGHTAIAADTGAGKTALVSMLVCQADKAAPRVFWFDNRFGATVFMRSMGGVHTVLSPHSGMKWNPFKLDDTAENRAFLVDLQVLMRNCYSVTPASADDIKAFKKVVDENYDLPFQDRRLRNVAWVYGHGELADAMAIWHGAKGVIGANAGVFDNEEDSIDLSSSRYYCFEMMELLKNGEARPELPVLMSYPLHRIELAMNGTPFVLVLEEGQNLVKNEYWRKRIDNFIMQIRRKNGILVFVTPDAKYFRSETDSIDKQTATKIYLSNDGAQEEDHQNLTAAELKWIREIGPASRKFLIRRGKESVRAVFDLSSMPEFIPVLSSNDVGVALMESIIKRLGTDDPEQWVPVFMAEAQAKNTHNLKAVN